MVINDVFPILTAVCVCGIKTLTVRYVSDLKPVSPSIPFKYIKLILQT